LPVDNRLNHGSLILGDTNIFYPVSGLITHADNDDPVNSGYVKAYMYDREKDMIVTVDSTGIKDGGFYCLPKCKRDSLFIMAYGDDENAEDAPGFHDTTINWLKSFPVSSSSKHNEINIKVNRCVRQFSGNISISGRVFNEPNNVNDYLEGAIVYARLGSEYICFSTTNENGYYMLDSLPAGNLEIMVGRLGYYMDYKVIQLGQTNIDTVNFYLSKVASVNIPRTAIPVEYTLYQNYPNPFNPATIIKFDIPKQNTSESKDFTVKLVIYDALGREAVILVNSQLKPGEYAVEWDASNYPSGVYFYKLITSGFTETRKMVLLK
jgi:hypothetical protein